MAKQQRFSVNGTTVAGWTRALRYARSEATILNTWVPIQALDEYGNPSLTSVLVNRDGCQKNDSEVGQLYCPSCGKLEYHPEWENPLWLDIKCIECDVNSVPE